MRHWFDFFCFAAFILIVTVPFAVGIFRLDAALRASFGQ